MIRAVLAGARAGNVVPVDAKRAGGWDVDESFRYCERLVRAHASAFPVARFVPPDLRPHVCAIWAFARAADDFADEPEYAGRRGALLDHWETELERCFHGEAEHPVFVALRDTVERRDIPIGPLRDLITAFRIDLVTPRHATFASLKNYCQHSAEAVGRLTLYCFDYRDAAILRFADDFATGLQLVNVVQDVRADLAAGRVYVPQEDLVHFGVDERDLGAPRPTQDVRHLIRFQSARARAYLERGRPLLDRVGRDLGFELSLLWESGRAMLEQIEAADYDVLSRRPSWGGIDKVRMVMRSAARRFRETTRR